MPVVSQQTKKSKNIVLRKGINIYGRYLASFEAKLTASSIKHISADTYINYLTCFNSRPMLSRYYMIYAEVGKLTKIDKRYIDYLKALAVLQWVKLIIVTDVRETFDELKYIKPFSDFIYLNCYGLSAEVLEAYIHKELLDHGAAKELVTSDVVTRIRRRARYKEYVLNSVLPHLACTKLTVKDINKSITPYTGVTLSNFGRCFFNPEKAKPVSDLLIKYRKYPDTIYHEVQNYVSTWLKLYDQYHSGELSEDNLLEWIESSGKSFGISYDYQAKAWLQSFSRYSYDFMILVILQLQEAAGKNNSVKMLALYKIYRMVNNCG